MKELVFKKVDAFASNVSSGNPAAVVYLKSLDEIDDKEKLQVARELKGAVSEVGFVAPGDEADVDLCFFSSEREVAFCGHATIAIMYDLIRHDLSLQAKSAVTISTRTEKLIVENRFKTDGCVFVSSPSPVYQTTMIEAAQVADALKCKVDEFDNRVPLRIVNAGLETLIVPVNGLSTILAITPDEDELNHFCHSCRVDIIILFSSETYDASCQYRTRVFAPTFGYLEDPATGSGNSALGYYLLSQGLWNGEELCIEQNAERDRPNYIQLIVKQGSAGEQRVWFGGQAKIKISGSYYLE